MRFLHYIGRPIRVPALAVLLLALSAATGNLVQWEQKGDLQAQANANNEESECRSRIVGYVDGLSIEQDSALGIALLDRTGESDDAIFRTARESYERATKALTTAKDYRERAVEVCAADPTFDPQSDIP